MLPIVLAHGIARFDALRAAIDKLDHEPAAEDRLHYFRRIRSTLLHGSPTLDVTATDVEFAASVEIRSATLRGQIEKILLRTQAPKVHIIAHSMGGLDARRMMFNDRDRPSRDGPPIHTRI